ncbi:hypothetical protein CC2G_004333 [Coprinopsis cinerea AmutBmut pab1-1]|nr:hypothetical protein CC2G_004333 [Coprinopsis cinerea AmutBmut pab1-1]
MTKTKGRGGKRSRANRTRKDDDAGGEQSEKSKAAEANYVASAGISTGDKAGGPSPTFDTERLAEEYDVAGSSVTTLGKPADRLPTLDTAALAEEYNIGSSPPKLPQTAVDTALLAADYDVCSSPSISAAKYNTAALAADYHVGTSQQTGITAEGPKSPTSITAAKHDTAALAADYHVGTSQQTGITAEGPKSPTSITAAKHDTAALAADYHVGTSQQTGITAEGPKSPIDSSAAALGETSDNLNTNTAILAREYFDDPVHAEIPLMWDPFMYQEDAEDFALDDFRQSSVAASDDEMDGGECSDVTLVGIRTRCRESLLDSYMQEKLTVQALLDCRRRITDYITLLTRELESMEGVTN